MIATAHSVGIFTALIIFGVVFSAWGWREKKRTRRETEMHRAAMASRFRPSFQDPMWGITSAPLTKQPTPPYDQESAQ